MPCLKTDWTPLWNPQGPNPPHQLPPCRYGNRWPAQGPGLAALPALGAGEPLAGAQRGLLESAFADLLARGAAPTRQAQAIQAAAQLSHAPRLPMADSIILATGRDQQARPHRR
ncbi:MAG: hypothetical protein ACK41W_05640 [Cyanobacteriota bacterium]